MGCVHDHRVPRAPSELISASAGHHENETEAEDCVCPVLHGVTARTHLCADAAG